MSINKKNLIWIDLEMTGLNPKFNRILEIATLITNSDLKILAEGPVLAIYQNESQLNTMNSWNLRVHTSTGLIDRVKNSKYDEITAEKEILSFLIQWVPKGKSPICGNGIGQDRRFLYQYMPKLEEYFHYRYLDVSSLKELAFRWKPEILKGFKKKNTHKAIEDIRESVQELMYYRENFLML